ncbi:hypothetical protein GFS31_40690 (plasmid) [Leptolyngbya sp. BL0902]|nr:hypothetical protein GFS31_40690 [Leptolyngbya sp. BL0902]
MVMAYPNVWPNGLGYHGNRSQKWPKSLANLDLSHLSLS